MAIISGCSMYCEYLVIIQSDVTYWVMKAYASSTFSAVVQGQRQVRGYPPQENVPKEAPVAPASQGTVRRASWPTMHTNVPSTNLE